MSNPTYYYVSYSEYDLGEKGIIFRSKKDAYDYCKQSYDVDPGFETWEEFSDPDGGLFVVKEVWIYEPSS